MFLSNLPEGVEVRPGRMETEAEQRAYLAAYDAAFGDEGKSLADLLGQELPEQGGYGVDHESLALLARHAARRGRHAAPGAVVEDQQRAELGGELRHGGARMPSRRRGGLAGA